MKILRDRNHQGLFIWYPVGDLSGRRSYGTPSIPFSYLSSFSTLYYVRVLLETLTPLGSLNTWNTFPRSWKCGYKRSVTYTRWVTLHLIGTRCPERNREIVKYHTSVDSRDSVVVRDVDQLTHRVRLCLTGPVPWCRRWSHPFTLTSTCQTHLPPSVSLLFQNHDLYHILLPPSL